VTTVIAVGAVTGTALAATNTTSTTTPPPAATIQRGSMDAMHAQMIAHLPAAQRAVCDKMHDQMGAPSVGGQTGMMSGHTGATASVGGMGAGMMSSGS
jgi:Spy/CpxP family protein refolding chaperone